MILYIKNMVNQRRKMLVEDIFKKYGIPYLSMQLGRVETAENIPSDLLEKLKYSLDESGLQIINDRKTILVEQIKILMLEQIYLSSKKLRVNYSTYLSDKLNKNYTYLSTIFSQIEGYTIEHFIISHRIKRAKKLIHKNELNITEIADTLDYSSVAHFSNQFKKETGMSPSYYRNIKRRASKSVLTRNKF